MSAAAFLLALNVFVAGVFAIAFAVIALWIRTAVGARWLAAAYALGMINPLAEFFLPGSADPRPLQLLIFLDTAAGLALCIIGLALHYRLAPPARLLALLLAATLAAGLVMVNLQRGTFLYTLLYQAPYAAMMVLGISVILRNRARRALDHTLLAVFVFGAAQFLAKPFLARAIGLGQTVSDYISSTYAAISQSLTAVLLITVGLVILLIIIRDVLAEIIARAETDTLSGLLNRRGFDAQINRVLPAFARTGVPCAMVMADLDRFKSVNDRFGHAAGDQVIRTFADILRQSADAHAVIGRPGGEEFVVFLPGADLAAARQMADTARAALESARLAVGDEAITCTASFGVAMVRAGDDLPALARRADKALYRAKAEGRNRVSVWLPDAGHLDPAPRIAG